MPSGWPSDAPSARAGSATHTSLERTGDACGPINSFPPVALLDGFLYIGSQRDASNRAWLDATGIKAVLNMGHTCGRPQWARSPTKSSKGGLAQEGPTQPYDYLEIRALDAPSYPILSHLADAVPFLERHRRAGRRVLISCHQGINRSATIAAAYLSALTNTPMPEIIEGMRAKRPVLQNDAFVGALLKWDRAPLRRELQEGKMP